MSTEVQQAVEQAFRQYLRVPTGSLPEHVQVLVSREAARLSGMVAQMAAELSEAAVAAWTRRHGREPDYLTATRLIATATQQARSTVLSTELEPEGPSDPEEIDETVLDLMLLLDEAPDWGNPDRWRTAWRSEPSEEIVELVARLWPRSSDLFAIKAEYLLQCRAEDGQELPQHADGGLGRQMAQLVMDDLVADGLPTM